MEATVMATSTKLPAILTALPEFISARLFSAATSIALKPVNHFLGLEMLVTAAIGSSAECSRSSASFAGSR
jgi:hypothetical protein